MGRDRTSKQSRRENKIEIKLIIDNMEIGTLLMGKPHTNGIYTNDLRWYTVGHIGMYDLGVSLDRHKTNDEIKRGVGNIDHKAGRLIT